ncbi:glycerophosphodiester phosphodiesterase [Crenothrix sp.]|uniref:glycerophosphodiester phosphodiesterase n=1 Tax=Crenothrix sp. TaxID=3100433 RepID=UPI00374D95F7
MKLETSPRILNIAHRGARAYAPENTLVAFAKAKTFGCQMFEMDVRLSKDGVVIVHHDEQLTRCTDVVKKFPGGNNYKIADFTVEELGRLDAGSWYIAQLALPNTERLPFLYSLTADEMAQFVSPAERQLYASGAVKIPTLMETLALAKNIDMSVNIELKALRDNSARLVTGVLEVVEALNMENNVLISSFEHDLLRQIRQQSAHIATAALTEIPLKAPLSYLRQLKVNAYNLACYKDLKHNDFSNRASQRYLAHIEKIRKANFGVNIWTCNDREELRYLLAAGVTGLVSDYPNRVREIIAAYDAGFIKS